MLSDETLLAITNGTLNPGRALLSPGIADLATDTGDMRQNLPILYATCRAISGVNVLEIGTNDGTSTLALLKAASEAGGRLTSIDLSPVPVAEALVDHFSMRPAWEFLQGDSHTVLPRLISEGRKYNVILVDGDHSYDGARRDIEHADALLAKGGVLFTHDSFMFTSDHDHTKPFGQRAKPGCGLCTLDMLKGDKWVGMVFPFNCNLAIWRRREDSEGEIQAGMAEVRKLGLLP